MEILVISIVIILNSLLASITGRITTKELNRLNKENERLEREMRNDFLYFHEEIERLKITR